jgi:DNA-directed RNA polymerase sigma subunit (sigma70/sigma32)
MELMIWNVILSFASGLLMFWVKVSHDEVKRLGILLSKTREEHSDKFVTKQDMHNDINRVLTRLDRLESKIDDFMKEQRSALG